MLMPVSIITTGLKLAVEILRTFNNLPEDLQDQIVQDILKDKKIRDDMWQKVTSWFGGLFEKVDVTK